MTASELEKILREVKSSAEVLVETPNGMIADIRRAYNLGAVLVLRAERPKLSPNNTHSVSTFRIK